MIYRPKEKNIVKLKKFLNDILGTNKYIRSRNNIRNK